MELGVGPFHLDVWLAVSNDLRLLAGTVRSVEGGLVSATFMAVGSKILRADLARTTALFHAKDAGLMEEAGRGRRRDLARQWELARHGEGGGEGGDDHVNMSRSADLRCDKGCVTKLDQLALKRSTRGGVLPVWLHHELDNTTAAGLVFSIYGSAGHGHDANMCITRGGIVLAALECERFFNQRYFTFGGLAGNVFETQLREVFSQLLRMASIKGHAADVVFEVGLYATSLVDPSALAVLRRVVQAKAWFDFNHHMAHAAIGFFGSPFTKALVLSYDGGGNDGNFNTFVADRSTGIELVDRSWLPLGRRYLDHARGLSELAKPGGSSSCYKTDYNISGWERCLHLPGKAMGYSALGRVRADWTSKIVEGFHGRKREGVAAVLSGSSIQEERDLAATTQAVFGNIVLEHLDVWMADHSDVDGIVLTGGCALNVIVNMLVKRRFGYPVYVPSAPNDGGLAVGAAWLFSSPPPLVPPRGGRVSGAHAGADAAVDRSTSALAFLGPHLWDADESVVASAAEKSGARFVGASIDASVNALAGLLIGGRIVAVVRGRAEFGPRALGHRSLLADPTREDTKRRLNRLKHREWWRPVAPMVASPESTSDVFADNDVSSPFMSFAPRLKDWIVERKALPAVTHFDGTARVQTVTVDDDPWLHALLLAMRQKNGFGVLCNTSFNVRGKPILNRLAEALELLQTDPDLDALYVNGWLFENKAQNLS